ncbi:MAG TPA: type II secretion system F family protein [Xanthobacteraceae bacterium]|nr:type II secretion system F family protein [Xanthobacteraceae bacterium]
MNQVLESLISAADGRPTMMLSVLVFLATATLAFGIMAAVHVRTAVKRRAAEVGTFDRAAATQDGHSLRGASRRVAQRLIEYTNRHYSGPSDGDKRQLRRRLIQAGFLDQRAVAIFFIARIGMAIALGAAAFVVVSMEVPDRIQMVWATTWVAGLIGYFAPNIYLNRRITRRQAEHRSGFPDFMDLLVVCADAGLSMEASLDRVGRELADSYPSLAANIYMTTLEIRAGRRVSEALEHFGDRLGLDEARSFATLLQQSEELGSSLTEALRVYSDDMRHKRLSRAEEKAYSLPAKLSVPLTLCVFPVVIIVILLPVYVKFKTGAF